VPDLTRPEASTIVLGVMLAAIALVTVVTAIASSERRRRRESASLTAIDFVRTSFASRLARGEPMDELLLQVAEALRDSFGLDSAEIWLSLGGLIRRAVSDPPGEASQVTLTQAEESIAANARVSGRAWVKVWLPALLDGRPERGMRIAPAGVSGKLLGLIVIERAHRAEQLAEEADATLEELAREVAVGLNKQRLDAALQESLDRLQLQARELQESRARIVAAADAERQRIERDLHDGAQQYLVAVAVKARLIQQLSERDPARSQELIDQLATDIGSALEELRTLAHGIYPPLLSTGGLAEALPVACRRASLPAEFEAEVLRRYSRELEAAVYFCCIEALQNAGKYAGAGATARVRLWEEAGGLLFEVVDDGAGFDAGTAGQGAGITNMSDRIGAVGGRLHVESKPGRGTRVTGLVPLMEDGT
jgi:signal transduction histidine kinase